MAQWQRTLDISEPFQAAKTGNISVQNLAGKVSSSLRELQPFDGPLDDEKTEVIEEFARLAKLPQPSVEQFDDVMETLYDWADTPLDTHWNGRKACWVKTF